MHGKKISCIYFNFLIFSFINVYLLTTSIPFSLRVVVWPSLWGNHYIYSKFNKNSNNKKIKLENIKCSTANKITDRSLDHRMSQIIIFANSILCG